MSPYVVERDDGTTAALTLTLIAVLVIAVLVLGYFLWYAPNQNPIGASSPDVKINVTPPKSDVDVDVPAPDVNVHTTPAPPAPVQPPSTSEGGQSGSSGQTQKDQGVTDNTGVGSGQ